MTTKDRTYFQRKISALRKALQSLEEEMGVPTPSPKRPKSQMQQFEENYAAGTWRKPLALRKQTDRI